MAKKIVTCVTLIAIWTALAVTNAAAESILEKWPIGLICERGNTVRVGYLTTVKDDGSAIYQTTGAGRIVTVTPAGVIEKSPTMDEGLSCVGRTIDDLRKEGKTIEGFGAGE